jgi:hypothetical protein
MSPSSIQKCRGRAAMKSARGLPGPASGCGILTLQRAVYSEPQGEFAQIRAIAVAVRRATPPAVSTFRKASTERRIRRRKVGSLESRSDSVVRLGG